MGFYEVKDHSAEGLCNNTLEFLKVNNIDIKNVEDKVMTVPVL